VRAPLVGDDPERSLTFYATYFAFKCLDPDGWRIEIYWEPQ
jgi:hypothetical protein